MHKKDKKYNDIFWMLKRSNVNSQIIGRALKKHKEAGQVQPKKKTAIKSTVRTKKWLKK
jgi:hypothetical protein